MPPPLKPITFPTPNAGGLPGGVPTMNLQNLAKALQAQNTQGLQQALAQGQANVMQAGQNYNTLRQLMGGTTPFSNYIPSNYPHGGGGGGGGGGGPKSSNDMLTGGGFGMGFGSPTPWQSVYGPPVPSGQPNALATVGGAGGGIGPGQTSTTGGNGAFSVGTDFPDVSGGIGGPIPSDMPTTPAFASPADMSVPDPNGIQTQAFGGYSGPTDAMKAAASPTPKQEGSGATFDPSNPAILTTPGTSAGTGGGAGWSSGNAGANSLVASILAGGGMMDEQGNVYDPSGAIVFSGGDFSM